MEKRTRSTQTVRQYREGLEVRYPPEDNKRDEDNDPEFTEEDVARIVRTRDGLKESDKAYVLDSWGRSMRAGLRHLRKIGWKPYWFLFRRNAYVALDNFQFVVAYPDGDEDLIMGWGCFYKNKLFYLYTAERYRFMGIAKIVFDRLAQIRAQEEENGKIEIRSCTTKGTPRWLKDCTEHENTPWLSDPSGSGGLLRKYKSAAHDSPLADRD